MFSPLVSMLLQVEIALAVAGGLLAVILLLVYRSRGQGEPQGAPTRYTPGEQEILGQLTSIRESIQGLRERVDRLIPPYGRVGYVPTLDEIRNFLDFEYVKVGSREYGSPPPEVRLVEGLEVDLAQVKVGEKYIYIVRRGEKRLLAVGRQHLDYLSLRFLAEFLDYV